MRSHGAEPATIAVMGGSIRVGLDEQTLRALAEDADALERFAASRPDKARVVELRFFGGLTNDEVAEVMNVTTRTVERHWQFARAWLARDLGEG